MAASVEKKLPSFLNNEDLKLIIFGGKGGTGKTTSSAATAIYLAKMHPDKKIMVISTDPAHSLGDSFDCSIGPKRTPIKGIHNLWALEIDPPRLLEDFKKRHHREIREAVNRASFYGQITLKEFLSFSLPGMDEMMIFIEITNMFKSYWYKPSDYDLIILDTAPTGHTIRLLSFPEEMEKWIDAYGTSLQKYRIHPRLFSWGSKPKKGGDFVDQFVERMRMDLQMVNSLLKNDQKTEFIPVTIPEPLSIAETEDLISALKEMKIPVRNIVINRIQPDGNGGCKFCSSRAKEQKRFLAEINGKFDSYNFINVPLFPYEIRGGKRLEKFSQVLCGKAYHFHGKSIKSLPGIFPEDGRLSGLLKGDLQFIMFGGKGGVGKTSMAAATGLYMAAHYPNKKILVYSVDPAHSLSDVFGIDIDDKVTPLDYQKAEDRRQRAENRRQKTEGRRQKTEDRKLRTTDNTNLYAMEVDAKRLHDNFIREYVGIIKDAFDTWESMREIKTSLRFDRNVVTRFAKSSPPGLDEVFALERIMQFVEKGEYDLYILDTAPTGHLLHLLEFPELVKEWLRYGYRALTKYQVQIPLTNLQDLGNRILKSTNTVRKIRGLLTDPQRCQLITITIPEAMGVLETRRLLSAVVGFGIPCQHIIINNIVPPTNCSFCASKRKEQIKYIQEVRNMNSPGYHVTQIPLFSHQIKGLDTLKDLGGILFGNQGN